MFFESMPYVEYQFGKKDIKKVENIVISVNPVDDIYSARYFDQRIIGIETPEELSEKLYRDPQYYWNLLYVNKVVNPFTDWVKSSEEMEEFCNIKYGDKIHDAKYFIEVATKQILVGVDEDKVYKYMEENDGQVPLGVIKITNLEFEQKENERRRTIRYVPESKLLSFNDTFETAMRINSGETR